MPKRFTETGKWGDQWFRELPIEYKIFWHYLCDQCDGAGVWKKDIGLASFYIGAQIDEEKALGLFNTPDKARIKPIGRDKWFILGFIEFQYGKQLSMESRPHIPVIALIEKYGLIDEISVDIVQSGTSIRAKRSRLTEHKKLEIFAEDEYTCQYCGKQDNRRGLAVDHIIPVIMGGDNEDDNLTTSCISCNSKKCDKDIFEFIEKYEISPLPNLQNKLDRVFNRLNRVSTELDTLKDKDKEQEEEKEREKGKDKEKNGEVKIFIDYAFEQFKLKTGEKLCVDGKKDGMIAKKLLSTYGLDKLKGLWDAFMQSDDSFIRTAGYSIGVFKSQINKLLTKSPLKLPDLEACTRCGTTNWTSLKNIDKERLCEKCLRPANPQGTTVRNGSGTVQPGGDTP